MCVCIFFEKKSFERVDESYVAMRVYIYIYIYIYMENGRIEEEEEEEEKEGEEKFGSAGDRVDGFAARRKRADGPMH